MKRTHSAHEKYSFNDEREVRILTSPTPPIEETISVRGTNIRLLRGGTGEALVYLHGAAGGGRWLPGLDALSRHYTVYAPEHPGFGKSDDLPSVDNMTDLAFFYLDFLDQMNIESAIVVGSSLGGWLALELAVIAPQHVKKMILLDSAGIRVEGVTIKNQIFLMQPEEVLQALYLDKSIAEQIAKISTADPEAAEMAGRNRRMAARLAEHPYFHNPKLRKRLHRVKMPVLVMWGEKDEIFPINHAYEFIKILPDVVLSVIANCGHLPLQEKTEDFYNEAMAFLEEKS